MCPGRQVATRATELERPVLWPLCLLLNLYLFAIFGRVLLSWFPLNPNGPMATVAGFLCVITDPVMNRARRVLPAARLGGAALDFSPIIVILGIVILQRLLRAAGIC